MTRFRPVLASAVLVVLSAGVTAAATAGASTSTPAAPVAHAAEAHGPHLAGAGDMAAVQHAVQSAYCPAPGSEITGGTPTRTVVVPVRADGHWGDGPITLADGELVRLRLENADDVAHEVGVYHPSRPGCPLVLATAGPGSAAEVDLRLGEGTYVFGDRNHEDERDLLTVQSAEGARP